MFCIHTYTHPRRTLKVRLAAAFLSRCRLGSVSKQDSILAISWVRGGDGLVFTRLLSIEKHTPPDATTKILF